MSRPDPTPPRTRRPTCERCRRPRSVCYCAALTTVETVSRIVILQHPREHGMPIGTAHMAHLCLPQSSVHVGIRWDDSDVLRTACADPARPPVLLYPADDARDILREPPPGPVTLVVIDGTWSQAKSIVKHNPRLAALPRYAFRPPEPSRYRIRREPHDAYVSTLEALMHVLGALEGDPARFRALRAPMDAMVDAQLEAQARAQAEGGTERTMRRRIRRTRYERLHPQVREGHDDIVLVYGDANAWPRGTPERAHGDELVHWVALRPKTGETFARVLAPRNPLAPDIPRHTGLSAAQLRAGVAVEALLADFGAFLRPTDVIASWGHHALRLFQDCGGVIPGGYLDLQQAARDLDNVKAGALERYAAALPAAGLPGLGAGRAGRRLGLLAGILAAWRAI